MFNFFENSRTINDSTSLTTAEAMTQCRETREDKADEIALKLSAARKFIENKCRAYLLDSTVVVTVTDSPKILKLPYQIRTINSVVDGDGNEIEYTFTGAGFYTSAIELDAVYDTVVVNFDCGYETLPDDIKIAIYIATADLYDTMRNSEVVGVTVYENKIIESLIAGYVRTYI